MPYDWKHKTVVIVGGASGLGAVIATAFAERDARLVLIDRDEAALHSARERFERRGQPVLTFRTDVTSTDGVQQAFAQIRAQQDSLNVLVNAVGRSDRAAILETSEQDFQALWDLNFLSIVRCTRAAADSLIAARGHVVNIGSLASKIASRYLGAYPATKSAVAAYSQQLRLELGPQGLHVLLVCPGPLQRDDAGRRYDHQARGLPESARRPGGGARVRLIDPAWLARRIIRACERRQPELIVPGKARWLFALSQLWPRLGDWIITRKT